MHDSTVTFDELRELLVELGFGEGSPRPDRVTFRHAGTDIVLLFRPHQAQELVSQRDLLVVRRQLVDNGLIDSAGFDRFLHRMSA